MIRRNFLALLGGLVVFSFAAHAEQPGTPVVGFLNSGSPTAFGNLVTAFRQGLSDEGYVDGSNVRIDYRWAQGHYTDLDALAAELVRKRVSLIAATGGVVSAQAALKATASIPIVFVVGFDPVGLGLVKSLNEPGGNATGISIFTTELIAKRVELLYQLSPGIRTVGILVNPNAVVTDVEIKETIAAIERSGRKLLTLKANNESEIETAFASAAEQKTGGLIVSADPFFTSRRAQIVALAARYAIPAAYPIRQYADAGGLMSYGPNLERAYRDSGAYAGRILKGAKPTNLPVALPTAFNLVINLKTAKALGLNVSPELLAIANDVIE